MKRLILLGCSLAAAIMMTSCASLFSGPKNIVTLVMEPTAKSTAPAKIYIDGDFAASHNEGMPWPQFELPCKKHRFKIVSEGYEEWEKDLIVLKGAPHRFVAILKEEHKK